MPSTLEVLKQARVQITEFPESYEFMNYCHCLAGHVYLAATGEPFDEAERRNTSAHELVPEGSPFGKAIVAVIDAHDADHEYGVRASRLSHINSSLVDHDTDGDDPYRTAAVQALDNTILHLSKELS